MPAHVSESDPATSSAPSTASDGHLFTKQPWYISSSALHAVGPVTRCGVVLDPDLTLCSDSAHGHSACALLTIRAAYLDRGGSCRAAAKAPREPASAPRERGGSAAATPSVLRLRLPGPRSCSGSSGTRMELHGHSARAARRQPCAGGICRSVRRDPASRVRISLCLPPVPAWYHCGRCLAT